MITTLGVLRPLDEGEAILLTTERVIIGSHRLCDVIIHAIDVAPVHCQLHIQGGWWHVRNLTNSAATRVNAFTVMEERLVPGDVLWIGSRRRFEVEYDPELLAAHAKQD